MDGHFPGPVTTADVAAAFIALRASPDQQEAMLRLHEAYEESFRALRESALEDAVRAMRALSQPVMPALAEARTAVRLIESGRQQIERLDDRFFDQIDELLAPVQRPDLARFRQARAIERALAVIESAPLPEVPLVDLWQLLETRGLDPAAPELRVDGLILQHEERTARILRDVGRAAAAMFPAVIEALARAGIEPGSPLYEGEAAELARATVEQTIAQAIARQIRMIVDLAGAARRSGNEIADVVEGLAAAGPDGVPGPIEARRLRRLVLAGLYPEVGRRAVRHNQYEDFVGELAAWAHTLEEPARTNILAAVECAVDTHLRHRPGPVCVAPRECSVDTHLGHRRARFRRPVALWTRTSDIAGPFRRPLAPWTRTSDAGHAGFRWAPCSVDTHLRYRRAALAWFPAASGRSRFTICYRSALIEKGRDAG